MAFPVPNAYFDKATSADIDMIPEFHGPGINNLIEAHAEFVVSLLIPVENNKVLFCMLHE